MGSAQGIFFIINENDLVQTECTMPNVASVVPHTAVYIKIQKP